MIVVLPVLDPAAARGCVATMHPTLRAALLIIDQSQRGMGHLRGVTTYRPRPHSFGRLQPRRNLGVSRCMNLGVDRLRATEGDLLVWVSTSMRFGPDGGMALVEAGAQSELGVVGMPTQWHAVALRLAAFDLAGRWDEQFFSGYNEDQDWRRRLQLATGRPALPTVEIGGSARDGHAYDVLRSLNPGRQVINFAAHKAYFAEKWGGCPPESDETFSLPWGDRPLDYWPEVSRETLIQRYGLGL